jgi:GNAT superfamily N-acetyltransferase
MLFADHGYPAVAAAAPATPVQYRAMLEGRRALVATDPRDVAIGLAITEQLSQVEWLCELSVHPDHGRRGVGAALLEAVADAARRRGCDRIGLSTFRAVPFNAPFYAANGFGELALGRAEYPLADRFHAEVPAGVAPGERVLMVRAL